MSENEIKKIEDHRNRQIQFIQNDDKQSELENEFFRLHGDRIHQLADSQSRENGAELTQLLNELREIKQKSPFHKGIFKNYHPSWKNVPHVREKPKWQLNHEEAKRQIANPHQQTAGRKSRKKRNRKNKSRRR